jgi:hypothetical protein
MVTGAGTGAPVRAASLAMRHAEGRDGRRCIVEEARALGGVQITEGAPSTAWVLREGHEQVGRCLTTRCCAHRVRLPLYSFGADPTALRDALAKGCAPSAVRGRAFQMLRAGLEFAPEVIMPVDYYEVLHTMSVI